MENEKDKIVKLTAKRKDKVVLPAKLDTVIVSNRVTEAQYKYSLIQEKIFNYVLFNLQEAIKLSMKGQSYRQLDLFANNSNNIEIKILLRNISSPDHYRDVREAAEKLQDTKIRMKKIDENGKPYTRSINLFGAIETPDKGDYSSYVKIEISKEVAVFLIDLEYNKKGEAILWTSFLLQIATNAKTKYTSRIYKLISSWKNKGGFKQSLEEFRNWLELDETYKDVYEIKRRILIPVQKELEGKADCWFNCKEKTFFNKVGNKIVGINWKIITPEFEEMREIKINNIRELLTRHLSFKGPQMAQIEPYLSKSFDHAAITDKIMEIMTHIRENRSKIKNPIGYTLTALIGEFNKIQNK